MGCGSSSDTVSLRGSFRKIRVTKFSYRTHRKCSKQHMVENLVHEEIKKTLFEVYKPTNDRILGTGISGVVRSIVHRTSGEKYALKTFRFSRVDNQRQINEAKKEVRIMAELDHPNIIRLQEYFLSDDFIHLVLELCTGGNLLERLNKKKNRRCTEAFAVSIIRQLLRAVRYLHLKGIAHRDIKLENILFEHKGDDSAIKLIDFGLSRHYQNGEKMTVPLGTAFFVAPEVLDGDYTQECDIWAIGVMAYFLVFGTPPFMGKTEDETLAKVRAGKFEFPSKLSDSVSSHAKDFITKTLEVDPEKRLTAAQALSHSWMENFNKDEVAELDDNVIQNLFQFGQLSLLRRVAQEVVAFTLRPEQVENLRKEFLKIDKDGSGEIEADDMKKALSKSGKFSAEQVDFISAQSDVMNNGKIQWIEFLAAAMSSSLLDEHRLETAFDRIDLDSKGFVTIEDLHALVGVDIEHGEIDRIFEKETKNTQVAGQWNLQEFINFMKGGGERMTDDGLPSNQDKRLLVAYSVSERPTGDSIERSESVEVSKTEKVH